MLSARKVKDKYGLDLHLHFDSFWFSTVKSVLHVAQDNFMDFHPACTAGVQPNSFSCSPLHKLLPAHVNAPGVMSTSFLSWHFKSWHLIFISFLTSEKLTENKLQEITNEMFVWLEDDLWVHWKTWLMFYKLDCSKFWMIYLWGCRARSYQQSNKNCLWPTKVVKGNLMIY